MNILHDAIPPFQRAIIKSHLCSTGIGLKDLDKPLIGVVNSWNEIVPGHVHLREIARCVKKGILAAGGYPLEFNTIAICDGIAQGHGGMRYSLPSREIIADSIEAMVRGHAIFDGLVFITACDKITPAMLMAAARLNLPSIIVTGGPMVNNITPLESKNARQAFLKGQIDEAALVAKTLEYYPGPGICPFLGTANTMCIMAEALGMTLPHMALTPAATAAAFQLATQSGVQIVHLVEKGLRPRDVMTHQAFLNAIKVLVAIGGSLNAVLHLEAIAKEVGINLTLEDFDQISQNTPYLVSVYPNDLYRTVVDIHRGGGIPALLKVMEPLLDTSVLTVTGCSLGENISNSLVKDSTVIHPLDQPLAPNGGITVLYGNLAPEGAVVKTSAVPSQLLVFRGPAQVFESQEAALEAAEKGEIKSGEVVVVRCEGPRGGPGMRELHRLTEILSLVPKTAIVTDGRFSGASAGLAIGYVSPEAAAGGPIALVEKGDIIEINIPERKLTLSVREEILAQRLASFKPVTKEVSGCLAAYRTLVGPTFTGAIRQLP